MTSTRPVCAPRIWKLAQVLELKVIYRSRVKYKSKIEKGTEGYSRWKLEKIHTASSGKLSNDWSISNTQKGRDPVFWRESVPSWHATPDAQIFIAHCKMDNLSFQVMITLTNRQSSRSYLNHLMQFVTKTCEIFVNNICIWLALALLVW